MKCSILLFFVSVMHVFVVMTRERSETSWRNETESYVPNAI